MRHITTILLSILFSAILLGRSSDCCSSVAAKNGIGSIESIQRENLIKLSDRLQECRFELPQASKVNISRNQQPAQRQLQQGNEKCCTIATFLEQQKIRHIQPEQRIAITTSQHKSGYYIYALRHIII